jgi:hypothetical protein
MASDPDRKKKIASLANAVAAERDADVLILNFGIEAGFDTYFYRFMRKRALKRKNVVVLLTTEGGSADAAYRICRYLQDNYETLTIVAAGWCKSAGTLICVGANELIICDEGELGPLDVQIAKADELGERSSGLAIEAAFEKLQQETMKLFLQSVKDIKEDTPWPITYKTAADMAGTIVVGVMSDVFAKLDPLAVGEDYRSNLIAEEYAIRLNLKFNNLKEGNTTQSPGRDMLVRGYPSHRFVIDRKEALNLFKRVSSPTGSVAALVELLERDVIMPRNQARNEGPRLEYLNDERPNAVAAKAIRAAASPGKQRPRAAKPNAGKESNNVPGGIPASVEQEPRRRSAA